MGRLLRRLLLLSLLVGGLSSPAAATDYTQDANCKGAWLMEQDGNQTDSSGEGQTLTNSGAARTTTHKFGSYAQDFENGDSDYMYLADGSAVDISGANCDLSIALWVKPESNWQAFGYVSKGELDPNIQWNLGTGGSGGNNLAFWGDPTGAWPEAVNFGTTGGELLSTDWKHCAVSYDHSLGSANIVLYVDGVSAATANYTSGFYNSSNQFKVGYADTYWQYFDGIMDDLGVFDRALSSTEINDIMDNGLYVESAGATGQVIIVEDE